MKRILMGVLTLALAASMCIPAHAEDLTYLNDSTSITPRGVVVAAGAPETRVSADITWQALTFVYKGGDKTWNPDTYTDDTAPSGWDTEKKTITVTNHSNTGIRAKFSFTPEISGIVGTFESAPLLELDSAEGTEPENAPTGAVQFGISGGGIDSTEETKIGTITIAVTDKDGGVVYKSVSSDDELRAAIAEKTENIRLANDISMRRSSSYEIDYNCTIDLNGHTIDVMSFRTNAPLFAVSSPESFCLKNGTVKLADYLTAYPIGLNTGCALTVENCTLYAIDNFALYIRKSNPVMLRDSTIHYTGETYPYRNPLVVEKGSLTLSGTVAVNSKSDTPIQIMYPDKATVTCEAGTYNFDPTAYVDTNRYDIGSQAGSDGATVWTVTEKS